MRIVSRKILISFYRNHADAETAIEDWYHKTLKADWNYFDEVRKTFNSVDSVGNQRYVFNIKGNSCRIIAIIKFKIKMVYIRFVGTHNEYDRITDVKNI